MHPGERSTLVLAVDRFGHKDVVRLHRHSRRRGGENDVTLDRTHPHLEERLPDPRRSTDRDTVALFKH